MDQAAGNQGSANTGRTLFRVGLSENLSLLLDSPRHSSSGYHTDRLQKGWLLAYRDKLLAEEGTGFGMPIVKYGRLTVFPGEAEVTAKKTVDNTEVQVKYRLDTIQRLGFRGRSEFKIPLINRAWELFSVLHRRFPLLRRPLDVLSAAIQNTFGLEPVFKRAKPAGSICISYLFRQAEARITVEAELDSFEKKGCTEIIIANEQGASFDRYRDSSGRELRGKDIGTWDEVTAGQASFSLLRPPITFTLDRVAGARLFRGREMKTGRLAWSGLNYVTAPYTRRFAYEIKLAEG